MNDTAQEGGRSRRWSTMAGLVAGGAVAGAVLAGVVSANAATTTPSPSASSSSSSSTPSGSQNQPSIPAHGSAAHEDAEKPVTGDAATKAKAAAVAAVGGGTAGEVTTDFTGNGYEVTVTKADGTTTEVHLNASFEVQQGGPGGGGPGGGPGNGPGDGPSGANGSGSSGSGSAMPSA